MEIQKIFSSYDDYGYEDSRIYSVLMSEDEMYLFSEIQKEFARADYAGLTKKGMEMLKSKRDLYAKQLLSDYRGATSGKITKSAKKSVVDLLQNQSTRFKKNARREVVEKYGKSVPEHLHTKPKDLTEFW